MFTPSKILIYRMGQKPVFKKTLTRRPMLKQYHLFSLLNFSTGGYEKIGVRKSSVNAEKSLHPLPKFIEFEVKWAIFFTHLNSPITMYFGINLVAGCWSHANLVQLNSPTRSENLQDQTWLDPNMWGKGQWYSLWRSLTLKRSQKRFYPNSNYLTLKISSKIFTKIVIHDKLEVIITLI